MVIEIIIVAALALGTIVLIGRPLLAPRGAGGAGREDPRRREVQDALDRSLDAIDEISFDHRAGHLSDDDFAALDADERARALELLRRRDELL